MDRHLAGDLRAIAASHSTAAGLNPFFDVLGPAERLAMMLDHLDELPLRNHEIRGNPAGLLARLLAQIDELKAGSDPPEPDLAEFCAAHDRIVAESGNLDEGDVFLTLGKLLHERPDIRAEIATRFAYVMVDEYEDTTPAQRTILAKLAEENPNHLYALEVGRCGVDAEGAASSPARGAVPEARDAAVALQQRAGAGAGGRARGGAPAQRGNHAGRDLRADRRSGGERRAGLGGDGGARRPLPPGRAGGAVPAARGARRDRLAARARGAR